MLARLLAGDLYERVFGRWLDATARAEGLTTRG